LDIPLLSEAFCQCDQDWQGESDFQVTNSLLDCQINVIAIRVLWCIFLAFHIVYTAVVEVPKLRWLWRKHQGVVDKHRVSGKKYRIWENKGLFSMLPYLTIGWTAQLIFAIVKIVDQNYKIGSSVLVTIMYILWRTTFIFCPDTFQPALLASLLKTERNLDHIIELNRKLSLVHMIVFMSSSILTIIPMVIKQDPFRPIVGVVSFVLFCAIASLTMLALAVQAFFVEKRVQKILVGSFALSKDARTAKVMSKIALNQRDVIKGGLTQAFIYGAFTVFPYLWNKHDYLVPFSWIFATVQIKRVMDSLIQEDGNVNQSTDAKSQPIVPVGSNLVSSIDVDTDPKQMAIYGLTLDPLASNTSTHKSEEGDSKA